MYSTTYYLFNEIINHSPSYNVFRYHAPWPLNLTGSKLYKDIGTSDKKIEPARNDDRVISHNRHILQLWRENIDWQPIFSKHVVIKYITKYASKVEKSSETYHQMLMRLSNMENPDDIATCAHRTLLIETVIERDIGSQETCHMLLELPLMESSRRFVNLNVSHEVFKSITLNNEENDDDKSKWFIDGYKQSPLCMEGITLIDATKSWIYNSKRKRENKWEPREKISIVRVFPRFTSIPPRASQKWSKFYFIELLLYKPFHDIERDIGVDTDSIIEKWDSFSYNTWHVQRETIIEENENINGSDIEEDEAIASNTIENKWEIISRLHNGQNMQVSEIDMLGRRDIDNNTNWSTEYQGEEFTMEVVNFIKNMKENGCLIYYDIPQCFNYTILSNKQQKEMNIVMTHYHTNEDRGPLFMIIQGTTRT